MRQAAAALAALLAASPLQTLARDVSGVKLADTVTVDGKPLQLNGAGMRKKLFIKVYVGALYLPARSSDAAAIVAADEPKYVRMVFVRDVDEGLRSWARSATASGRTPRGPDLAALERGPRPDRPRHRRREGARRDHRQLRPRRGHHRGRPEGERDRARQALRRRALPQLARSRRRRRRSEEAHAGQVSAAARRRGGQ